MNPIKDILRLILVTLLPIVFVALKTAFPNFPLSQDSFIMLVLWAIGLLIGGWQAKVIYDKIRQKSFMIR